MNKRLQISQYIGFFTIGLIANIIGPMLPVIRSEFNMTFGQAGMVLSSQFLGMVFTVLITGYLADKLGKRNILLIGSVFAITGLSACMFANSYVSLLFPNIIIGIGYGIYETGINALCTDSTELNKGNAMNLLHFFFGLGAVSGPVLATISISLLNNWRLCFAFSVVFPLLTGIMLSTVKLKENVEKASTSVKIPYKSIFLWIAGISAFIYVGIEVSIYGWLPAYWNSLPGEKLIPPSLIATAFWISLTSGRLVIGRLADSIGFSKFIILASSGVVVLSLGWWLIPFKYWTLLSSVLLGFTLAGLFPTIMISTTERFPGSSGTIAAFITFFSALGGFFIPSQIGNLADSKSVKIIPFMIFSLAVLLIISASLAWGFIKNINTKENNHV